MEQEFITSENCPKNFLLNPRISSDAKLIYSAFILGAIDKKIDITKLENSLGLSRGKRRDALNELAKLGFCKLEKYRDGKGRVIGSCWIIVNNIHCQEPEVLKDSSSTESKKIDSLTTTDNSTYRRETENSTVGKRAPILINNISDNTQLTVDIGTKSGLSVRNEQKFISPNLEKIPEEMKKLNQWVFWRAEYRNDAKKPTKIPYRKNGVYAKSNDPTTWSTFDKMSDWQEEGMTGIGFVLSEKDEFTIIDLDNCIVDGHWNKFAEQTVRAFRSYTELSPSGTGIHIIIKGRCSRAVKTKEIEIYHTRRYMAMTGIVLNDMPIENRQRLLDKAIERLTPDKKKSYNFKNGNEKFTMPNESYGEGERNNSLAKWAGVLNTKKVSENEYYSYLRAINKRCCSPPLSDREVLAIGKSIRRYG